MRTAPVQRPPARTTLRAHPDAPARVEVVYRPLPGRLLRTGLALGFFWGIVPLVVWLPPHYPWPLLSFAAGLWLAHRSLAGRFVVRSFSGLCPRCGRALRLDPGSLIDLPHTLTCFGCHFEPRLEVGAAGPAAEPTDAEGWLRHLGDCPGRWRRLRRWDGPWLECDACGARHRATPAALHAAALETERDALLRSLADEGRFL